MPAEEELTQIEKDKLAINPDFDFREIAKRPFEEITPGEMSMFKWSGVYQQLQKGFFMIRLRIPGGLMTSAQLKRAADLADAFGQGQLCITTRQCLQFHWVRKEDIYRVLEGMKETGILSHNACGDVTRNVVGCPLAGVCPEEIADTLGVIQKIADDPELMYRQRNLPRKHKISVAGCGRSCGQTLMNCQGWFPVTREGGTGWKYFAGGGLGAKPFMAKLIFEWVPEDLVIEVTRAAAEAFRRHGNRRVRALARLKIVVDRMGPEEFGRTVLGILRERNIPGTDRIEPAETAWKIRESFLSGQAVIAQKQKGMNTVRVIIRRSEMTGTEARRFADWAREYGDGTVLFTNRQNLEFRFVPDEKTGELRDKLTGSGYAVEGFEHLPDMVACVGTTVCNLAVSDTPNTYRKLMAELTRDKAWWQSLGPLRIHMNGCPNSCGQHAIADIGLRGTRKRTAHGSEEGYSIYAGGSLAGRGHIAEYVCDVTSPNIAEALREILDFYLENRTSEKETFGEFARRLTGPGFKRVFENLPAAGEPVNERNLRYKALFDEVMDWARRSKPGGES